MGGASTATMAASLAIMYSRGVRELCSTEAMVMSASVSRTGPSVLMNSSSCECGRSVLCEGGDEDGLDSVQAVLGLRAAAEFDGVVHPGQDGGGVGDRFLVPELGTGRVEVGHVAALVEVFSKISAISLPGSRWTSLPAYLASLS